MFRSHANLLRRLRLLVLACIPLAASGCLPGVAWLPDSSGFIYVAFGEQNELTRLVHYDLAAKKTRVLVGKIDKTGQPALSPDGKRLAVAKYLNGERDPSTLQVVIYDLQGKELVRSQEFDWRAKPTSKYYIRDGSPPALYWSPKGHHVVVISDMTTGLFDVKQGAMKVYSDTIIVCIAGSPIRPDGAGFLTITEQRPDDKKESWYAFIDWQGKVKKLGMPPELPHPPVKQAQRGQVKPEDMLKDVITAATTGPVPSLRHSRWDKEVAEIFFSGNTLRIDTGKAEVSLKRGDPVKAADGSEIDGRYPLGPDTELRTVFPVQKKDEKRASVLPQQRVELVLPGQKEPKVLVRASEVVTVTPSPNGEWLAVRCFSFNGKEHLLLVNRKGEVIEVEPAGK
jgi:hypothetical protein